MNILVESQHSSQQERDYPSPDPLSMVFEFSPSEYLRQIIYILIFHGNLLKEHASAMHAIFEFVVPDVYVVGPIMKHYINREFNATLVITMYHFRIHLRTKQTNQDLSHPDSLTCSLTCLYSTSIELSATDHSFLLY